MVSDHFVTFFKHENKTFSIVSCKLKSLNIKITIRPLDLNCTLTRMTSCKNWARSCLILSNSNYWPPNEFQVNRQLNFEVLIIILALGVTGKEC